MVFSKVSYKVFAIFLCICSILTSDLGYTHSGRTDVNGGHYNRKTGEYHKHIKEGAQLAEDETLCVASPSSVRKESF